MNEYRSVEPEKSVFLSGKKKEREEVSKARSCLLCILVKFIRHCTKKSQTVSLFLSAASA